MSNYADAIVRPPKTFTDHERHGLLRATGERVGGFRDHVLYSMAENTALRQMELLALNVGDLLDPGGRVRRRIVLRVFKRSNKNVDDQTVFLSDTVRAKVARLIELRRRGGEVLGPDSPLFVSSRGTRLSARRVRSAFASWQRRAGFERQVTFHTIRHYADLRVMPCSACRVGVTEEVAPTRAALSNTLMSMMRLAGRRRKSVIGRGLNAH